MISTNIFNMIMSVWLMYEIIINKKKLVISLHKFKMAFIIIAMDC